MSLHDKIAYLPAAPDTPLAASGEWADGYAAGHRDARHAAAELALKADALAEAVDAVLALDPRDSATEWNNALYRLRDAKAAFVSG